MPGSDLHAEDLELPAIYTSADLASGRGQRRYLALSATRFVSIFVAATAGAIGAASGTLRVLAWVLLAGFVVAAFAEFALIRLQPERAWYSGRAIAESAKTLAWRFSVRGEPYGSSVSDKDAEALLLERIREIVRKGSDKIDLSVGDAVVTESMRRLRSTSFDQRRSTYLAQRTEGQRLWYSSNAKANSVRATSFRFALLAVELIAIVAAALALGRAEPIDFAGIAGAVVAAGAAWMALKQYSQLTSAYRVAAVELAIQATVLKTVEEDKWDQAVADAEEAISREHTMWLASRGEEPLP
ncbi:MAG TPA: DUF4231 domain-containing protein [Lacisediminihabitans sp.]|uniref:DUF4231 domain-containing protein n=1 Tax=Lacisediminihabitans sp. TaxID=2787631 RepID=UPI002EDA946C